MDRVRGEESALVELAVQNAEPVPRALQGFAAPSTDFPLCTPIRQEPNPTFWAAPEGWDWGGHSEYIAGGGVGKIRVSL